MANPDYITIDTMIDSLKESPDQLSELKIVKDVVERILELQKEKNVLILGHNYMEPKVYHLSPKQYRGDSLQLSRYASQADNPMILFDGVRFMAETAKILNPEKKVLIGDINAGCSLADPFTAKDVLEYKLRYHNAPVITYINSYAEVKAESDYCCTSANALKVVGYAAKEYNTDTVLFFPDSLMGENLQEELNRRGSKINLIYPGKCDEKFGACEVHLNIKPDNIVAIRKAYGLFKHNNEVNVETAVLVHWECLPETVKESDFVGSTSEKEFSLPKRVQVGIVIIAGIALIIAVLVATGQWDKVHNALFINGNPTNLFSNVLLIAIIAGALIIVVMPFKSSGGKKKDE